MLIQDPGGRHQTAIGSGERSSTSQSPVIVIVLHGVLFDDAVATGHSAFLVADKLRAKPYARQIVLRLKHAEPVTLAARVRSFDREKSSPRPISRGGG